MTVSSAYGDKLAITDYGASVVTIDASSRTAAIDITGNAKNNKIYGGTGNDVLRGGSGKDTLFGGAGNDLLYGNDGNDSLIGGAGNYTLIGDKGNDTLTGGDGVNVFYYSNGDGNDVIVDYVSGRDVVKIASGKISDYSSDGKDATLKIGSGKIILKGIGNNEITVVNADNATVTYGGVPNGVTFNSVNLKKATSAIITPDFSNGKFVLFTRQEKMLSRITLPARTKSA